MVVLQRSELEQSPLSDLHALASELGVEGYRRLRKPELIDVLVGSTGGSDQPLGEEADARAELEEAQPAEAEGGRQGASSGRRRGGRRRRAPEATPDAEEPDRTGDRAAGDHPRADRSPADRAGGEDEQADRVDAEAEEVRTGVLDILPNGSGFVRADPFAHGSDDVYVSPAQIRRCELRTGDEVSGPVRAPRRSERYPSLVHVESVNGGPAEPPAERPSFSDLTPVFPSARLATPDELAATPFGRGSRVAVAGPPGAGATMLLRRIVTTLAERHPEVEVVVVLAGVRPEEVGEWRAEVAAPVVGGSFDASPDRQGEVALTAAERAKRTAERGGHAAVLVDSLEFLPAPAARRVFGTARNTEEAGSVTVIAATGMEAEPARHASTRIVLVPSSDGVEVDAAASTTLRADRLS